MNLRDQNSDYLKQYCSVEQRPRQHGRRIVFNDHSQQSQINKLFDLKYKETTLAVGLTNIQINEKLTGIELRTHFFDCLRNWRTYTQLKSSLYLFLHSAVQIYEFHIFIISYTQLVELLDKLLSKLTILNGLAKRVSKT